MKIKMFGHTMRRKKQEDRHGPNYESRGGPNYKDKDGPPGYEGKEHVKYRDPGHTRHEIDFPEDEPHMKSHVSEDEEHEAEDNYHMDVPNQTHHNLEKHIKRAHMLMDAPDQEDPKPLRGNITHNVPYKGEEDTDGKEEMGPNDYQENSMPKEHRKKMIVAVMKRKMNKNR